MPNTVDLSTLSVDASKQLSLVQAGQMSMLDYVAALTTTQGITASWETVDCYVIDLGRGLKDPFGADLTIPELQEVVKALMPSPLQSAGKQIVLRGPMPGWVSGLVARVCYAADVIVEALDRAQGSMLVQVHLAKLERDQVRLVHPDTQERTRDVGNGWVIVSTSQVQYRRRVSAPPFDYKGVLTLALLETRDSRHSEPRAQVQDSNGYYAWVDHLDNLEDAQ